MLNEYNLNAITNSKGGISKTFEGVYPSRRVFSVIVDWLKVAAKLCDSGAGWIPTCSVCSVL